MSIEVIESILVADIGSVNTKVGLVDRVGNDFRVVGVASSPTTAEPPHSDVMTGLRQAVRLVQERTRRALITPEGHLISPERASGQGVDGFAAVTSAAPPLRVAVVGLSREVSVASAASAVHSTYATLQTTLAVDETASRWLRTYTPEGPQQGGIASDPASLAAEALAQADAEVIVLVGGVDGGATGGLYELANLIGAIAASREEEYRPTIIFAGNREARPQIANRLGQLTQLRVIDNVHPTLEKQNYAPLHRELETLYLERKINCLPGLAGLQRWTSYPVLPTAQAFDNVVRYLSRRFALNVVGADVGGTSTILSDVVGDSYKRVLRADMGTGLSMENVLKQAGVESIVNSLPHEASQDQVAGYCLNRILRPGSLPLTRQDARIEQAMTRQALKLTREDGSAGKVSTNLIVLSGGVFGFNSDYGALALTALDGLETTGVFTLAVDTFGIAAALGAIAVQNPDAAASVIERDAFVTLGTVIAPVATRREGRVNLYVKVKPADAGEITLEVEHGSLEIVPLAPGKKAELEVHGRSAIELGERRRGGFRGQVEGGTLGLIIDARGRPLALPAEPGKRREKIQQWYWDVGS